MRKMNWLVGSIALGIGLVIGMVGYALAITPVDGDSRLMSFWKKDAQPVTGTLQDSGTQSPVPPGPSDLNLLQPQGSQLSPNDSNGLGVNPPLGTTGTNSEGYPNSASGEGALTTPGTAVPGSQSPGVPAEVSQKIVSDYKQNIGIFFEAWKSTDMMSFRSKLIKAYTGDLYEKHARQAESFIAQGIGIDVRDIRFDQLTVVSATATSATLTASYHYAAQDYDLGEQVAMGEKTEHQVNVRVNLIKNSNRWLITGETPIQ
jgi:hypothetical protein